MSPSNFYRLTNGYNSTPRNSDLYVLINIERIAGRTGPIATIRPVTSTETRQISTDYLVIVSEVEAREFMMDLLAMLMYQAHEVGRNLSKF